ncbi:MAG: helix-turn-helix transcriptional regulator [Hyphomicrobiaceae bacterium]
MGSVRRERRSKEGRAGDPAAADPDVAYLAELGRRVRQLRAVRGMSRKTLATISGLSERYVAQIESGAGNVSIILLRRVAAAVGVPLDNLVHDDRREPLDELIRDLVRTASPYQLEQVRALLEQAPQGASRSQSGSANAERRVALIGLRGAGKSTLGQRAAATLGWTFVELNKVIEQEHGFSMTDIFTLYGQDGYRRFEREALRRIAARPGPLIMATGGGIVAEPLTLEFLLSSFFTVWIRALPGEHMARVRGQGDLRPMVNDSDRSAMTELRTILASREPLYERAAAVVDTARTNVEESTAVLISTINEHYRRMNAA